MALWPPKKEENPEPVRIEVPETPAAEAAPGKSAAELHELTRKLAELGQLLGQTNEQVVDYLIHRESQAHAAGDGSAGPLHEKLDALAEKLEKLQSATPAQAVTAQPPSAVAVDPASAPALKALEAKLDEITRRVDLIGETVTHAGAQETFRPALAELQNALNQQFGSMAQGMQTVYQRLDTGLKAVIEQLTPPEPEEPEPSPFGPAVSGDWQVALLGRALAENPGIEIQRQRLFGGLLDDDPAACSLVGQLLVFRSALAEKMPPLLKEIGEAYYRWDPKVTAGNDAMEEAIVQWLRATMQEVGIGNTVELVNPGERFDSTRHSASARGVEITEVYGWVVLRDNGRVYTKASVAVR